MKISVTGEKLIEQLKTQRARVIKTQEDTQAFLAAHKAHHEARVAAAPPSSGGSAGPHVCMLDAQVKGLLVGMGTHLRRLDAMLDVINAVAVYRLPLEKYLRFYVDSPFDGVLLPDPETADGPGMSGQSLSNFPLAVN